jgi:hypothetical protein
MFAAIVGFGAVAFLLLGLAFAPGPAQTPRPHLITEAVFAFVAFCFLLLLLRIVVGPTNDPMLLPGDLFASFALTFFWVIRKT